jgi:hypothetical protein
MRRAALASVAALAAWCLPACDSIFGIDDHGVAPEAGGDAASEGSLAHGEGGTDATRDGTTADAATSDGAPAEAMAADAAPADAKADVHDGSAPTDATAGCDGPCSAGGPAMVPVSTYYVDSTEVTVAQYQQFLAAKGTDTSGQPPACAWNTTYAPSGALSGSNFPITSVDWCDAFAFCAWAGKHLCGSIADGGAIASSDTLKQNVSQWFLACGGPGGSSDPNGHPMCNATFGASGLIAVASDPGCEGWYAGLFDLEGNAAEWVDSCDVDGGSGGATDTCYTLGGSFYDETAYCTESIGFARNTTYDSIGFRCCRQ